jgi:RNA polymerase sigma-70 factor (ECF subfamily)
MATWSDVRRAASTEANGVTAWPHEHELAAALGAFDAAAWRHLFDAHYTRIYRYAYARTGNEADAQDIAASVFAEAVRGIDRFRYRGAPVVAWLFGIAHNETVDALRRRKRAETAPLEEAAAVGTGDAIDARRQLLDVSEAMAALKAEHRDVLTLRLVEGRSIGETATLLGKTEAAVKMTQMRGLRALRERLTGEV